MENIQSNFEKASKWSVLTEIISKLLPPVTNMILARLLTPDAFGLVATITMVTSFAEIFADAGFQKYIVQHDFSDNESLNNGTNVAFWTNLSTSMILWLLIIIFRTNLASALGNPELGLAIAVSAVAIPTTSFSSIQIARYRRSMDFKNLFFARLIGIFVPLFVTVPLAFLLRSYWAIVLGNLVLGFINAILLTIRSEWKPKIFFRFAILKEMFTFSIWALIERLLGWANLNIGIFIVGIFLSEHYLGLYKISMSYVNQVLDIIVNSLSPVLLSTLSRMREDKEDFRPFFYQFEEKVGMIIIPLGVGIFVFQDLFTQILLGSQWIEASAFIGLWALMRTLLIVFGMFSTDICIAMGKPQYSVIGQMLTLSCLLPALLINAPKGYESLYISRSLVVLFSTLIHMILFKIVADISPMKIVALSFPYFLAAILMGGAGWSLQQISDHVFWHFAAVFLCILIYFFIICLIPRTRKSFFQLLQSVLGDRFPYKNR